MHDKQMGLGRLDQAAAVHAHTGSPTSTFGLHGCIITTGACILVVPVCLGWIQANQIFNSSRAVKTLPKHEKQPRSDPAIGSLARLGAATVTCCNPVACGSGMGQWRPEPVTSGGGCQYMVKGPLLAMPGMSLFCLHPWCTTPPMILQPQSYTAQQSHRGFA